MLQTCTPDHHHLRVVVSFLYLYLHKSHTSLIQLCGSKVTLVFYHSAITHDSRIFDHPLGCEVSFHTVYSSFRFRQYSSASNSLSQKLSQSPTWKDICAIVVDKEFDFLELSKLEKRR